MKKLLIGILSFLTICAGIHIGQINLDLSNIVTISEAEARRGRGARHRGRRAHRSVHVDVDVHRHRGGAFVAGALVGAAAVAIGTRHTYLPHGCTYYDYYGRPYYNCAGVYYQPVYDGPEVVYVVVDKP